MLTVENTMASEETLIKKILGLQVQLLNKHKLASLFSYPSKFGQVNFGSKEVIAKFRQDFDQAWEEAFDRDTEEMMHQPDDLDYYDEEQWGKPLNFLRSHLPASKLPADLDLMNYKELWKWISNEILKEYWGRGGEKRVINYGNPDFLPTFWPNDVWPWADIKNNPKNMKASDFPGTGNMTECLKDIARKRFDQLEINPADHVDKNFTEKKRKNRQKHHGKAVAQGVEGMENPANTEEPTNASHITTTDDVAEGGHNTVDATNPDDTPVLVDCSNMSEILASNNINLGSTLNFAPNISIIPEEDIPEANSTLVRASSRSTHCQNFVSSSLQNTELPPPFQPRRKRPSELNCAPVAPPASRPRRTPHGSPVSTSCGSRRSTRSRSNHMNFNIPNPLNVEVGQARTVDTDMHIARDVLDVFTTASENNTKRGLETGAVLAGHFLEDEARSEVTHLVIPIQTGMPDSWTVSDERQITNFFITHPDLILLGLIHTHPNTSPVLTSMDLHSLWSYAKKNPAIISLVVSPDENLIHSFSMTPLGLREISACRQTGFHQHAYEDTRLFMESPHVIYDETMSTILVDHRLPEV